MIHYVVVRVAGQSFARVCRDERESMAVQFAIKDAGVQCFAGQSPNWAAAHPDARTAVRPFERQIELPGVS